MFVLVRVVTYAALFIGFVLVYLPGRFLSWSGLAEPATTGAPNGKQIGSRLNSEGLREGARRELRRASNEGTLRAFRYADRFTTFKIFRRPGALRRRLLFFPSFRGGRQCYASPHERTGNHCRLAKLKP